MTDGQELALQLSLPDVSIGSDTSSQFLDLGVPPHPSLANQKSDCLRST
jgi:hypothetical protein